MVINIPRGWWRTNRQHIWWQLPIWPPLRWPVERCWSTTMWTRKSSIVETNISNITHRTNSNLSIYKFSISQHSPCWSTMADIHHNCKSSWYVLPPYGSYHHPSHLLKSYGWFFCITKQHWSTRSSNRWCVPPTAWPWHSLTAGYACLLWLIFTTKCRGSTHQPTLVIPVYCLLCRGWSRFNIKTLVAKEMTPALELNTAPPCSMVTSPINHQ